MWPMAFISGRETYDRDMKDILAVQSEVAQRVVRRCRWSSAWKRRARWRRRRPRIRKPIGFTCWVATISESSHEAVGPTPSSTSSRRCKSIRTMRWLIADWRTLTAGREDRLWPGKEAWAKEKELAQKALALDPNLAEAHLSLGIALFSAFDWDACEKEFNRALELNPSLALAYDQYGWTYMACGRFDEAIAKEKKAMELDPLNILFNTDLGFFLSWARRYDEAMAQFRKTLELDANNALAHADPWAGA